MRVEKARLSLEGLSVGDAFGEQFFFRSKKLIEERQLPPGPWPWTDDTHMALSIVEVLLEHCQIEQEPLAQAFSRRFREQPGRGYGSGARRLLARLEQGEDWRQVAPTIFPGGSYGNGAAMRAAPIGGYFFGEPQRAVQQARLAAEITHAHPEGQSGAMAVAAAAALAAQSSPPEGQEFLTHVLQVLPDSLTRAGVEKALSNPPDHLKEATGVLGTGSRISAQDTVPFCLWCAAYHLQDYAQALWTTVSGMGDRDTTCAIVGGIVALSAGQVPENWRQRREPLPEGF
jgi:ADP-ribosylglycohydrolase